MIYVTHDQTEAMTLADDIVVLDTGIVSQKDLLWIYMKNQIICLLVVLLVLQK